MRANYRERMDRQLAFVSEKRFVEEVEKQFNSRYEKVVDDVIPQWLAVLMWTELTEYHHTIDYCRKKLETILYVCDMIGEGYGTGNKGCTIDVLESMKERGLDIVGIYRAHEQAKKAKR